MARLDRQGGSKLVCTFHLYVISPSKHYTHMHPTGLQPTLLRSISYMCVRIYIYIYIYIHNIHTPKRVSPPADRFFTARSEDGCVWFMIFTYARLNSELGLGVAQTHARPSARRFAQQSSAAAPPPTSPRSQQFVQRVPLRTAAVGSSGLHCRRFFSAVARLLLRVLKPSVCVIIRSPFALFPVISLIPANRTQ